MIRSVKMYFIKKMLERELNCQFNYCLINLYRNGKDHVGWHCDDEAIENGRNVVASISLGQTRRFGVRYKYYKQLQNNNKNNKNSTSSNSNSNNNNSNFNNNINKDFEWKYDIMLKNGSLVVMRGNMQKYWQHCIYKTTNKLFNNARINLTFRSNNKNKNITKKVTNGNKNKTKDGATTL